MALAVIGCITGAVIDDAQAVRKSYPSFWNDIQTLDVRCNEYGVDQ